MIEIKPKNLTENVVTVPGSKSYTHRILIASALAGGPCVVENALQSEDTLLTMSALQQMGVPMKIENNRFFISGVSGRLKPSQEPIYLGNSGTSMRLLTAVAALGQGAYTLTGTERMKQRPIDDLLEGLRGLGIEARSVDGNGCPPVRITGAAIQGGKTELRCKTSSQFLSAVLLIGPYTREGVDIRVTEGPVSKPYIDMTLEVMQRCGVMVSRDGYERYQVPGGRTYEAGDYYVEPDCSQAGYFWGAAAITGSKAKVLGTRPDSRQGDVRFARVLGRMGCSVMEHPDGIMVVGGPLKAIEVDMSDLPDMVPTLAVVAAFAEGTTRVKNVAHLKAKESDRLGSVVAELNKIGVDADCDDSGMTITGADSSRLSGARIQTYDDHRIAMSFSMAGLKVPGIKIENESCVNKSFPNYWEVFKELS